MVESKKKGKIPGIRFPEFCEEWDTVLVSELVKRVRDPVKVVSKKFYREIGIRSHGKGVFHKESVSGADLGDKRVFHVVPGSLAFNIVFAWEQAVAILSEDEDGFIASHRFPMYLPKRNKSDTGFLRELFLRPRGKFLLELASPGGAGRNKTLGQKELLGLKVTVPCQREQQKIATFLRAVDEKIGQLERKKELLETYKKGCMQKLFSRELRFKDDQGRDFPDWQEKQLGATLEWMKDGTHATHPDDPEGKFYLLSAKNLKSGRVVVSQRDRRISQEEYDRISKNYSLRIGDILLSIVGSIGEVAVFDGRQDVAFQRSVAFLRIRGGSSRFFANYFRSPMFQYQLMRRKVVSAQPGIYLKDLKKIPIKLPHPDEQRKIASFLSALDGRINLVAQKLNYARTFKRGLLQQMFV